MTNYKFIGTGVTDASGVARLTKDPNGQTINGYVGSGVGEVDFVASLDNPISSGSIVSETYELIDSLFYDIGTDTSMDSNWTIPSSNFERAHSNDGVNLKSTATSGTVQSTTRIGNTPNWLDSNTNYQIECDFSFENTGQDSGVGVSFGNVNTSLYSIVGGQTSGSGHVTIISNGSSFIVKYNGVQVGNAKTISNNYGFRFQFYKNCEVTVKNLVIYIIG